MDNCVDCLRPLRDSVCSTCNQIFVPEVRKDDRCWNCGKQMLVPISIFSKIRFRCGFCAYSYFSMRHYNPEIISIIDEEINSVSVACEQCGVDVFIDSMTQELICRNCGLVNDQPIFLDI